MSSQSLARERSPLTRESSAEKMPGGSLKDRGIHPFAGHHLNPYARENLFVKMQNKNLMHNVTLIYQEQSRSPKLSLR
jgi:hypothetical protein